MKLKKALCAALTAALAVTAFAGCGSKPSDQENAGGSSPDAAAGTEASGADTAGGTIKIGGIGPLTGGAAVYGIAVKNGAELAVKEINEAGGIGGMQVEIN